MTTGNYAGPFEIWKEMFQKSTEAWEQAAAGFAGFRPPMPGSFPFDPAQFGQTTGFNAFFPGVPSFPAADVQSMWRQFFESWAEQWGKNLSAMPGAQVFQDAQKQWAEQLESLASAFAEAMGSEDFSRMLGKYMEQSLVWQERMAKAANPQLDAMLRSYNLPSRAQIDRLFERIIGLEERLDDLEDGMQKIQASLSTPGPATTPASAPPWESSPPQP